MCCDKIILCLSLVLFIMMMYGEYHVINVILMGVVCLLLVNRVIKYEYFNTVSMKSLTGSIENPLNNEQQMQELVISQLENKVKMYKKSLQEPTETDVGILIESSCQLNIDSDEPDTQNCNIQIINGLEVKTCEGDDI